MYTCTNKKMHEKGSFFEEEPATHFWHRGSENFDFQGKGAFFKKKKKNGKFRAHQI